MKALDPISVIEAAYRVDAPAQEWLTELAAAANAAAGIKRGAMAVLYDASRVDWVDVLAVAAHEVEPAFVQGLFEWGDRVRQVTVEDLRVVADCYRSIRVGSYAALLPPAVKAVTADLFARFDLQDLLCINATDPTARGCLLI